MIVLITGMMAAGKSTVAQSVAERLNPSVHLRGDAFRKMIVNGRQDMSASASKEALHQLSLRYKAAMNTAKLYSEAGFAVIYQDTIIGPALAEVVESFGEDLTTLIVLNPSNAVIARRESERTKSGYGDFSVDALSLIFNQTPKIGYWLDNSNQSVLETTEEVLHQIATFKP